MFERIFSLHRISLSCLVYLLFFANAWAAAKVPRWLLDATSSAIPSYGEDVSTLVLLDHKRISVKNDGTHQISLRYAVKVLTKEGESGAIAQVGYSTDTDKVRALNAWLIRPSGLVLEYGKKETVDIAFTDDDLYNESRNKVIVAADDAEPGAVFGFEAVVERRPLFGQMEWYFQDSRPTLLSRFELRLPDGWRANSITMNHESIEPEIEEAAYSWSLRNLPPIPDEPLSPPLTYMVPRLLVSISAPESNAACLGFSSWSQVSAWLTNLNDPQVLESEALVTEARDLANDLPDQLSKIRAIGAYVQKLSYVSVQIGLGRGGGYRPRPAREVFANSYGDCKDKVNLMRTMLRVIGIQSLPVAVYSGDPNYVFEGWPSPAQFNHYIIGIQLDENVECACDSIVEPSGFGRLLIFDPTEDDVPLGILPRHQQGGLGLLVAGKEGALIRLPLTNAEDNRTERSIEATLSDTGDLMAEVIERTFGRPAVSERKLHRGASKGEYRDLIERWIVRGAPGATVADLESEDDYNLNQFALRVKLTAPRYGQSMQGQLLIFRPILIERRGSSLPTSSDRKNPIWLGSKIYDDEVRVELPPGFGVDELPDDILLEEEFGTYSATFVVDGSKLDFSRRLTLRGSILPAQRYDKVKGFFESIRNLEQLPVVLARD
jgi:hypothetical protein